MSSCSSSASSSKDDNKPLASLVSDMESFSLLDDSGEVEREVNVTSDNSSPVNLLTSADIDHPLSVKINTGDEKKQRFETMKVWSGCLEYFVEYINVSGTRIKVNTRQVPVTLSTKGKITGTENNLKLEPEFDTEGLPYKLKMRLISKDDIKNLVEEHKSNVNIVQFLFDNLDDEWNLNNLQCELLFNKCGILSLGQVNQNLCWSSYLQSSICIFYYCKNRKGFFGIIPKDQISFKNRLQSILVEPSSLITYPDSQLFDVTVDELLN